MPDESWMTFASSRLPYRIRIPEGWVMLVPSFGWGPEQVDPSGIISEHFRSAAATLTFLLQTDMRGLTSSEWFTATEGYAARDGLHIESSEPIVVAGMEARLYQIHRRRFLKKQFRSLRATFHDGTYGWYVFLTPSDPTGEPDRSLFVDLLANFERIDILLAGPDDTSGNVWALQPGDCFASLPLGIGAEGPAGYTMFMGGVDGFRRVACSEPHTGEVAAVVRAEDIGTVTSPEQYFEAYVGGPLAKSEFGILLMNPLPTLENVPPGVEAVLVIAHPAGPWSGSARGSGR